MARKYSFINCLTMPVSSRMLFIYQWRYIALAKVWITSIKFSLRVHVFLCISSCSFSTIKWLLKCFLFQRYLKLTFVRFHKFTCFTLDVSRFQFADPWIPSINNGNSFQAFLSVSNITYIFPKLHLLQCKVVHF